ncbi:acyl carrier protein [Dickeya dadantii]|uniref:acyl carrier protein n=1 Tax=Dickeya dadantii TaxID=204038 RepID=UPI001495D8D6|nr:acyl carrier protein [Dickeya dadantii]NPE55088.1 acyl carrier protein [Dickeya dadantii]NPE66225.1 acyl carrier protein [Dickeya dadantii]
MDKNEIYNEIKTLLVKLFELDEDEITLESRLYEDLELDSIDAVDMVVHLQKRIGRKISPETFKSVRTVQDVVTAIEQLMDHEGK